MKEIKVFYSQPMHDRSIKEIREERINMQQEFTEFLEKQGYTDYILLDVNDRYDEPTDSRLPYGPGRLWYLGRSIQAMDRADYVCFHTDWYTAKECYVEKTLCDWYFRYCQNFMYTKHIGIIFWGNNSGSTDLTMNNSHDSRK